MTVSVILKALNEEARIGAALTSVVAALDGIGGEIIVADGGSRDRTVSVASAYPVRVVQLDPAIRPSCGIGPQLGFQYSREPFICLMDGDMLLDAGFLRKALAYLEAHPSVAGVTGHVEEMNDTSLEYVRRTRRVSPENRTGSIDRMNGGGLYRRAALEQVGYLSDRNLHGYEEFDLGLRLRAQGWDLYRLDCRFVRHFGHAVDAYALLVRRWKSGYLRGIGEVLRAALGTPRWGQLVRELPELKLWAAVYLWLILMLALPLLAPSPWLGLGLDLVLVIAVVGMMALRQRSLRLGLYAVVAWIFHAAALPLGFLKPQQPPGAWIDSRILQDAVPAGAGTPVPAAAGSDDGAGRFGLDPSHRIPGSNR